jgi:phage-related protein
MPWVVDFYKDAAGAKPVEEYLDDLPVKHRAKLLAAIEKLRQIGPTLPFPYSSQVEGKLRELRTRFEKTRLRILYYCDENQTFQLLHGIVKNTAALEESDIKKGSDRLTHHNERLSTKGKRPKEK